jgi:hypothetical protein
MSAGMRWTLEVVVTEDGSAAVEPGMVGTGVREPELMVVFAGLMPALIL